MKTAPILYLLVEESDREFLARCLIGRIAAARGYQVVIGPQWWIWESLDSLAPGIMFFKGNNGVQVANMHRARQHGHVVVSIEEEALGVMDEREIVRLYDPNVYAVCDMIFVQSAFHAECVTAPCAQAKAKIRVVGNPRADLLRPPFDAQIRSEAREIRKQNGRFVLLNTNFGSINPASGDALTYYNRCVHTNVIDPRNPGDLDDFWTWCRWERDNAAVVVEFARKLAARVPDVQVILRPHPAENLERWLDCLAGVPEISVIREGSHLPWTVASCVMVHPGCTTGVEAAILGAPALSLAVGENRWHGMSLSNAANPVSHAVSDAVTRVEALLKGAGSSLENEFAGLNFSHYLELRPDVLASRRLVDCLDELNCSAHDVTAPFGGHSKSSLAAWQRHKYSATLGSTRNAIAGFSKALGLSDDVLIENIAGLGVLIRCE